MSRILAALVISASLAALLRTLRRPAVPATFDETDTYAELVPMAAWTWPDDRVTNASTTLRFVHLDTLDHYI